MAVYIHKRLKLFIIENSKPVAIYIERQTLRKPLSDEPVANQLRYKEATESLQYTTTISQLDISSATRKLARYAGNTSLIYWVGV